MTAAMMTFALFAAAAMVAPEAKAAPADPPAASHETARFTVTVRGAGPDVVLIPGLASSAAVWEATASQLSASHRVHVVQVAGFAGAPAGGNGQGPVLAPLAQALAEHVRAQGLKTPTLIGHSLGGELALMMAARHGDAASRVIVVDALPFYPLLFNPAATAEAMRPQAAAMRIAIEAASPEQFAQMQAGGIGRLTRTASARPVLLEQSLASDRSVMARATEDLIATDLRPDLARISVPVRVIYAYDAQFGVPAAQIDAVFAGAYAGAANVRLQRIDDSFHFIMLDQPERFQAALLSALSQ